MDPLVVLTVVAPIVAVAGILLVVSKATGGSRTMRIVEAAEAHRAILDADMTFLPGETVIGVDGHSALVADTQTDGLALAYVVGDRVAARRLRPTDVRRGGTHWSDDADGKVTLRIQLRDFGCPELVVRLTGTDTQRFRPRLDALLRTLPAHAHKA
ncbi:MAG: hypothetical protein ABI877_13255 [Gemmatimonadaceae bacterium]